jgi:sn-glycerol 3-phosphate transport system permease protein
MYKKRTWLIHLLLIASCVVIASPVFFALVKATQPRAIVTSPSLIPGTELFRNISEVWQAASFGTFMKNSFIIAIAVTMGKTALSLFAGMALVFYRFRFKQVVFAFILITLMMPTEILIVGLFDLISLQPPETWRMLWNWIKNPGNLFLEPVAFGFGWSNTRLAIIVPFLASATGTFLFRQHFLSIPRVIGEAARIDGAGPLRFLFRILIPMSGNTIAALAVVQFVYVWDQYLWPRVIIRHEEMQVVQVGLNLLISVGQGINWGVIMAGSIIVIIPPLLVFMLLQEQFMRGFGLAADK